MKKSSLRTVLIGGVSLLTVAAMATVWATSSVAAEGRYVTAVAETGDVSQSYLVTGTVSRENLVEAAFAVSGTVKKVLVEVGDTVEAGDVLATLDTTALKLALLNAETDLASAKATLYAAEHPSSGGSSSSRASGSGGSGGSGAGRGSGGTPAGSGGSGASSISAADAATLYEAIAAVNVATLNWSNADEPTTCDLIYAALGDANPGDDTSGDDTSGDDTSGDDSSGDDTSGDDSSGDDTSGDDSSGDDSSDNPSGDDDTSGDNSSGDDTGDSSSGDDNASGDDTEQASEDPGQDEGGADEAEQLALTVDDITVEDIQACGDAREALLLANAVLADYYQQLITTGTIVTGDEAEDGGEPADQGGSASSGSPSSGSSGSSSSASGSPSSSSSTSARAIASAEAEVLRATQAVEDAEEALENAELLAPISGTVGTVDLTKGDSASSGAIAIVGEGTALLSIEVPLTTRKLLSQGMDASVTPAGATDALAGTVSAISILETDGTAGDSPTYTTTVVVEDPGMLLKDGARASVEIVTGTASGVVIVPVSAISPTASGTGTVQVVESASADTAETVTVATGVVGGGRVEVTSGLEAGQIVVLSDRAAELPSTTSSSQRQTAVAVGR